MENLTIDSLLRWKVDWTIISHCITQSFSSWMVGRICIMSMGLKGLTSILDIGLEKQWLSGQGWWTRIHTEALRQKVVGSILVRRISLWNCLLSTGILPYNYLLCTNIVNSFICLFIVSVGFKFCDDCNNTCRTSQNGKQTCKVANVLGRLFSFRNCWISRTTLLRKMVHNICQLIYVN